MRPVISASSEAIILWPSANCSAQRGALPRRASRRAKSLLPSSTFSSLSVLTFKENSCCFVRPNSWLLCSCLLASQMHNALLRIEQPRSRSARRVAGRRTLFSCPPRNQRSCIFKGPPPLFLFDKLGYALVYLLFKLISTRLLCYLKALTGG